MQYMASRHSVYASVGIADSWLRCRQILDWIGWGGWSQPDAVWELSVRLKKRNKNPAGRSSLPGHGIKQSLLPVSPASRSSNALTTKRFTLFSTTVLARLLVAFFKLQALKQAIVLNLLFQNAHGFFEIVVEDFDFNCFQTDSTPFFPIASAIRFGDLNPDGYFIFFINFFNSKYPSKHQ
jgi:hypothetical protein